MDAAQNKIKEIVDGLSLNLKNLTETNNIFGRPHITADGCTILPISKLSFGFAAGGGEYGGKKPGLMSNGIINHFAGGSGGGASIVPVGFLIITNEKVQMLSVEGNDTEVDKFAQLAKDIFLNINR